MRYALNVKVIAGQSILVVPISLARNEKDQVLYHSECFSDVFQQNNILASFTGHFNMPAVRFIPNCVGVLSILVE